MGAFYFLGKKPSRTDVSVHGSAPVKAILNDLQAIIIIITHHLQANKSPIFFVQKFQAAGPCKHIQASPAQGKIPHSTAGVALNKNAQEGGGGRGTRRAENQNWSQF